MKEKLSLDLHFEDHPEEVGGELRRSTNYLFDTPVDATFASCSWQAKQA